MFIRSNKSIDVFFNDFRNESKEFSLTLQKGNDHHFAFQHLARDLFTLLYDRDPKDVEAEIPVGLHIAKQAIDQIKELREYKELLPTTILNPLAAGIAANSLAASLMMFLPPVGNKSEEDLLNEISICDEEGLTDLKHKAEQALSKLLAIQTKAADVKVDTDQLRQKMRVVIQEAKQQAEDNDELLSVYGYNNKDGQVERIGLKEKMELSKTISRSTKLKQIAQLAGRLNRIAKAKRKERSISMEFASVKTGDNLSHTLPVEFAKLATPELKMLFFKDFAEKKLLEYELGGKEQKAKGSLIICIDTSMSTKDQQREIAEKAIAMVFAGIAKEDKRDFILINYSSANQVRVFEARKGKYDLLPFLNEMEFAFFGGTDWEAPLSKAMEYINSSIKDGDIVFLSDDDCQLTPHFLKQFNKAKESKGFSCYGISVGFTADNMKDFCDDTFAVADLMDTEDAPNKKMMDRVFKV